MSESELLRKLVEAVVDLSARVRHLETAEAGLIAHAARHQTGGSDEISVDGLHGKLADLQDAGWLRGRTVSSTAPSAGQALIWNASSSAWTPTTLPTVAGKTLVDYGCVGSSSTIQLTNSYYQDVPGTSTSLSTQSGDVLVVIACFYFGFQYTSSSNVLYGALNINGTNRTRAFFRGYNAGTRAMATQVHVENISGASTTIKLMARRTAAGTGDYCYATYTTMTYLLFR